MPKFTAEDLLPTLPPEPPLPRVLTGAQEAFRDASKEAWRRAREMRGESHARRLWFVNKYVAEKMRGYWLTGYPRFPR